jgi:hypothetical protein
MEKLSSSYEYSLELEHAEQQLIQKLKENPDSPETKADFIKWCEEQESLVNESIDPDRIAPIQFNIKRGRIFFLAELYEEAFENFDDARQQAYQQNQLKLVTEIESEMDQMESKFSESGNSNQS